VIRIVSLWIADGPPCQFDPTLAPWFATCNDAVDDVREKLKRARRFKDHILSVALVRLRDDCERLFRLFVSSGTGIRVMEGPDGEDRLNDEDREAALQLHDISETIRDHMSAELVDNLALARVVGRMFDHPSMHTTSAVACDAMNARQRFERMRDPGNWQRA
jgi:hypothetical protein